MRRIVCANISSLAFVLSIEVGFVIFGIVAGRRVGIQVKKFFMTLVFAVIITMAISAVLNYFLNL